MISVVLIIPHTASGQIEYNGFIRNYNALQTVSPNDLLIGRNRLRLDLSHAFDRGEVVVSNDLQQLYSSSFDSLLYRLREAYVDLYLKKSDLRIGRQLVTWGRADGTFITDILNPLDAREFLTQDLPDIKIGVTAFSITRYFGSNYLQLIATPLFHASDTPAPDDRWFPRSFFPQQQATRFINRSGDPEFGDFQLAGRWAFRSNINFDLDLLLNYWHYPTPAYGKSLDTGPAGSPVFVIREQFDKGLMTGYSGSYRLTDRLILQSEAAFYQRRSFDYLPDNLRSIDFENPTPAEQALILQEFNQNTDGFLTEKPWAIAMIGLQTELLNWTLRTQLVNEHIIDYREVILQQRNFPYATLWLQRSFARDRWEMQGLARYNFEGKGFWFNPELAYSGRDNLKAELGGQLFGGKSQEPFYGHLSFSEFASNSFLYFNLTFYF
ncbi:MAG: DUF1302 family protein [Balneolaceae bacterium]|nr:DUF1302 family protein [Balneolaceae bacterium]